MVPMELWKIIIRETSDFQEIWLREKGGQRAFPILIGIVEAAAIDRSIREISTPRPLTHDLLANIISTLKAQLAYVLISSLHDNTFFSKLVIRQNGSQFEVDSRPSDAVAMAVRLGSPIYVEEQVLNHVCRQQGEGEQGKSGASDDGGTSPSDE